MSTCFRTCTFYPPESRLPRPGRNAPSSFFVKNAYKLLEKPPSKDGFQITLCPAKPDGRPIRGGCPQYGKKGDGCQYPQNTPASRRAPRLAALNALDVFENKFNRIYQGKQEIAARARIHKASATRLDFLENESVDYIYTDPPYGKNIPYLDLSAIWIARLDLDVSEEDYALEAIEGGSREKS